MGSSTPRRTGLLDGLTLATVARELASALVGARVQSVVQPDRLSLALEFYAREHGRTTLILTADPHREGVRLDETKARRGGGQPSPLTLASSAHLIGMRLAAIEQPPWERMLRLEFRPGREGDLPGGSWVLVAELMGRLANLVLVDSAGVVRACARQVSPQMSRVRTVIPGGVYAPPPAQGRMAAERATEEDVAAWLRAASGAREPAWRAVVSNVAGASPLSSREAVYRASRAAIGGEDVSGSARAPAGNGERHADVDALAVPAGALAAAIHQLFDATSACPSLAIEGGRPVAYAAYELTHLAAQRAPSVLAALAQYEDRGLERDAYLGARASVERDLAAALGRLERRRAAIERSADESGEASDLRLRGDLILAYGHSVQRGQTELVVNSADGGPLAIALNGALTAVANAEAYYKRARRAERAAEGRSRRLDDVGATIQYLEQLAYDLQQAENRPQIDAVNAALVDSGVVSARSVGSRGSASARPGGGSGVKRPGPRPVAGEPLRQVTADGFTVWIGRNASQNERVTFEKAARGDLWLHARDVPGAHVVIKAAGREIPESSVMAAAAAAAWHSRARRDGSVMVWVVDARRVRRPAGGRPGMATFDEARSVVVAPAGLSSAPGSSDEGETG